MPDALPLRRPMPAPHEASLTIRELADTGACTTSIHQPARAWRCGRRTGTGQNPQPGRRRIATVPFTLRNLKEDPEDVGSNFDGAPDLEFRLATRALELERSGLSHQRIPPGYRFPYGHTHREQEEVYVVVGGGGRMKLDDEIVEVGQ